MRRTPLALAALVLALTAGIRSWPALAGDDAVTEAVRALLAGVGGEARAKAAKIVREDPAGAARALIGVTAARAATGAIVTFGAVPAESAPTPAPNASAATGEPSAAEPVIQIYDVQDLVGGALSADELSERLRLLAASGGTVNATVNATERGQLVVRTTPVSHASVADFLNRLRASDATLYQIDARLIVAPMTATVGTQVMRARPGERVDIDDPLTRVDEWVRSGDVEVALSPRIACLRGQRGSVQVGRRISYVSDFDIEIAQSTFVADPIIDVVWDGVVAEFTPWPTSDGAIQLALEISVTDVEEPLGTFQTSLGTLPEPVTVQVPSFVRTDLSRSLSIVDGGSVLVRLADGPGTRRLMLLTVESLDLAETD